MTVGFFRRVPDSERGDYSTTVRFPDPKDMRTIDC